MVLDNDFGTYGRTLTNFGPGENSLSSLALQSDGKILAAGSYMYSEGSPNEVALSRYNPNGSIDTTFGQNGKFLSFFGTELENEHNIVRVQSDGKILLAATHGSFSNYHFVLIRLTESGNLDTTFGTNGFVISSLNNDTNRLTSMEILPDGKVILAGYTSGPSTNEYPNFIIAKYNADGSLDTTFGNNGYTVQNFGTVSNILANTEDSLSSIKIQPDGKILAAGFSYAETGNFGGLNFALLRLNADGSPDDGFGTNGRVIADFGQGESISNIQLLPDGKILAIGQSYSENDESIEIIVAKFNSNGTIDESWATSGSIKIGNRPNSEVFAFSSVLQADGKLIVVCSGLNEDYDIIMLRLTVSGLPDETFGNGGFLSTDFNTNEGGYTAIMQPDGKLLVGAGSEENGRNYFSVLRYESTELSVPIFNRKQISVYPNPFINEINVNIETVSNENVNFDLYDINGRKIISLFSKMAVTSGKHSQKVQLPQTLSKGVYFLNISIGQSSRTIKIIK